MRVCSDAEFVRRERTLICVAVIALLMVIGSIVHANAEPLDNVHLKSAATCTTAKGSTVEIPAGYFLSEAKRAALDTEVMRLQSEEARLTAENTVLREAQSGWQPGWKSLGLAFLAGIALPLIL